jgi:hypothetical protein
MPWLQKLIAFYKIARWFMLASLLLVIGLALMEPAPVAAPPSADLRNSLAREFEAKMTALEVARHTGNEGQIRLSAPELNAAFALSLEHPTGAAQTARAADGKQATDASGQVREVQISMSDDQITGRFLTELYGKDVYVTVSGKLGARDGYVTFTPTAFKIGELSVPVGLVDPQLQKKLAEPGTREKLKLPEYITDLRIEGDELVVIER